MKKKTHEEYVNELTIKNSTIEVVEKYAGMHTKITHHCLLHDIYWKVPPARILQGSGCEICKKEKFRQARCKTHHQYVKEVKLINPNIEVVEKYIDASTSIKHYCKKHDVYWNALPCNILHGHGCVECGKGKISDKNGKTHEQYVKELKETNDNIKVIGRYVDANIPILHKCLIDGYEWDTRPGNVLFGKGCPKCANNIKRSHDKYIQEVLLINSTIEVLEEYINVHVPIMHKCKKHNIQWKTSPASILQGSGCTECGKEKVGDYNRKSHEQYINELKEINPNIIVIENYINANTPILHKCLIDGNEWHISPAHALFGNGCPQCNESKGEKQIRKWLDKHNIVYEPQYKFSDCKDVRMLPFDFYLPEYNLCVEYQGKQHYEPVEYFGGQERLEYIQNHDNIKKEYCENNGISLLCIPYFKDVEEELNNFLFI